MVIYLLCIVMREQLRKAGRALQDFDAKYAERVRNDNQSRPLSQMLGGLPLGSLEASPASELAMAFAKEGKGPASKGQIQRHQALEYATGAGVMALNAGYRYGLPAAGVTLAGAGIIDLTSRFGSDADYPEEQQLTLQ